jgi:DNA-binding response OmpR family regulator/predicted regulator of Ras-like GTPase activity (Roadblock/LC7/MglB family)
MADRCRILVVEDDENLNRSIVNSLRKDGYFVHGVKSGAEAIGSLWTEAFDVVISDLKMPGPDGFELLQWLRAYCPNTRMIMVAPVGSAVTRTQALEGGVVSYLEKPLDLHVLKQELRRLLQQTGFSASLDSFDLLDVIQIITMSRKNIALLVNTGLEEQGTLRFQGGELVWAEYGILRGEEAFFALAAHKNGTVIHQPWNEQITPNVMQPLSRLIFQALQYRSKYAALQQQSGKQEAISPTARLQAKESEAEDDTPFVAIEELYVPHTPIPQAPQTPAPQSMSAASHERMTDESGEWWQQAGKIPSSGVNGGAATDDARPKPTVPHERLISNTAKLNVPNITTFTVRKTPASQRTDLPSWLIDQPTQSDLPTVRPSSLAGTAEIPIMSPLKSSSSSAEWQPIQSIQPTANVKEQAPSKQITASHQLPVVDKTSSEWQAPENKLSSQSGKLRTSKRNYSALVAALQTLGYSVPGFIATAVVSLDGQPIAQVAVDDLDISPVCKHFSNILQGALLSLDQGKWGHYEDTVITSAQHYIFLRIVGDKRNVFQVLITTREADPMESLEVMANVEGAIGSALQ